MTIKNSSKKRMISLKGKYWKLFRKWKLIAFYFNILWFIYDFFHSYHCILNKFSWWFGQWKTFNWYYFTLDCLIRFVFTVIKNKSSYPSLFIYYFLSSHHPLNWNNHSTKNSGNRIHFSVVIFFFNLHCCILLHICYFIDYLSIETRSRFLFKFHN